LVPFLTAAAGVTRVTFEDAFFGLESGEETTETEMSIVVGGGSLWLLRRGLWIRADVRDHLRYCDDFCDDEWLHDLEVSAGLEIAL
jgi:hypothetical protein